MPMIYKNTKNDPKHVPTAAQEARFKVYVEEVAALNGEILQLHHKLGERLEVLRLEQGDDGGAVGVNAIARMSWAVPMRQKDIYDHLKFFTAFDPERLQQLVQAGAGFLTIRDALDSSDHEKKLTKLLESLPVAPPVSQSPDSIGVPVTEPSGC